MKSLCIFLTAVLALTASASDWSVPVFNSSYLSPFLTIEEREALAASSSVRVMPRQLLRRPADFDHSVGQAEHLHAVLNRIVPPLWEAIGPLTLVVIVVKRDSVQKIKMYRSDANPVTVEQCGGLYVSPGDLIILGNET